MSAWADSHDIASKAAQEALIDMGLTLETASNATRDQIKGATSAYLQSLLDQGALSLLHEAFFEYAPEVELLSFFQACHDVMAGKTVDIQTIVGDIQTHVGRAHIEDWAKGLPTGASIALDFYTDSLIDELRSNHAC